ncbi:MAG: ABC transporter permease [Muribaculaceae bacterium]
MKYICEIFRHTYEELTSVFHDKGILIFILFVPLAYPLLYSYVYTNEVVRNVPLAVVDNSMSYRSREFVRKLDASPDVNVYSISNDMTEAEELMKRQKVYGILVIPPSFERDIHVGNQTYLGLYCDMCSMLYYKALMLNVTNVSLEMNNDIKINKYLKSTTNREEEIIRNPIQHDYVPLFNPCSGFASFLIPPVLMLIIHQTLLLGIGMSIGTSKEKFSGRIMSPDCSNNSISALLLGKSLFYLLLYVMMGIYMYIIVTPGFKLPQIGDFFTFISFLIPFLLACISFGLFLSIFLTHREDCIMLFVFLSVPLLFLSGISWPTASMSYFWKYFAWLFPSTFGMNGYVRIASMGASLADVSKEWIGLCLQTIIYFSAAYLIYKRQMHKHNIS